MIYLVLFTTIIYTKLVAIRNEEGLIKPDRLQVCYGCAIHVWNLFHRDENINRITEA